MSEFSEYRDHLEDTDKNNFLGSLVFYTVSDLTVPYDYVKTCLANVGLQDSMPKNPPADQDVFRRVFLNGQRRLTRTGPDESQRLLVREVSSTPERLIKRIVAEDVDGNNLVLAYTECVEVEWNKNHPEEVRVDELAPNAAASQLAQDLAGAYKKERRHLDGNAVRAIIVRCLGSCHATSVREGGSVYFVSSTFDPQIEALEKMAAQIPDCVVHSLPLIDDRKQRDFVREAFRTEATIDVQKMVTEVNAMLKNGEKITPRKFATYNKKYNQLKTKVKEYDSVLRLEQGTAEIGIEVLTDHMEKMFSAVTYKE